MAMAYYVLVRGTPCQPGVYVEGLDKRDENYLAIIDTLGFMMSEGGLVMKKPGSNVNCFFRSEDGKRVIALRPYMYPTDVLNILRDFGFKIVSTAGLPSGVLVWTVEKHPLRG